MLKPIAHRRARDRWLLALLTALLIMAVTYALCRPIYETNDDSSIVAAASGAVTGVPYAGNGFTSYLYGALLAGLFSLNAELPWHALFLMGTAFLSLAALIKCFACMGARFRVPCLALWAVPGGLYAGVLMPYVAMLQFTTIATLAAAGGTALLLCAGSGRGHAARFDRGIAGVLLLCAFALRVQSLWAAMPLLAAYGVLAWLESPRSGRKTALCCGVALALLGLLTAADSALYRHNEPGWDAFCVFNDRLSDLLDYNNTDLVDELAAEAAGWPPWTTYMVRNWYQLDEHMTLDGLTVLTDAIAEAKPAPTAASLLRATGSVLLRYPMFAFTLAGFGLFALWAFFAQALRRRYIWLCLSPTFTACWAVCRSGPPLPPPVPAMCCWSCPVCGPLRRAQSAENAFPAAWGALLPARLRCCVPSPPQRMRLHGCRCDGRSSPGMPPAPCPDGCAPMPARIPTAST